MMDNLVRTIPYEWTIRAAVKHSTSIMETAEGLARDIPIRSRAEWNSTDETLTDCILEAQGLMVAAGADRRSVDTLKHYRQTGLWAQGKDGEPFQWIPGASYTLHDEARLLGWSPTRLHREWKAIQEWGEGPLTVADLRRLRGRQVHGFG